MMDADTHYSPAGYFEIFCGRLHSHKPKLKTSTDVRRVTCTECLAKIVFVASGEEQELAEWRRKSNRRGRNGEGGGV